MYKRIAHMHILYAFYEVPRSTEDTQVRLSQEGDLDFGQFCVPIGSIGKARLEE